MRRRFPILVAAAMGALSHAAHAQSTAFTYQGELKNAGTPANGLYDIRFRLFDTPAGNGQVGSTLCVNNVQVSNGRFTTILDFGQQFANISARHLEIEVRPDSGQDCTNTNGYAMLTPRQQLTTAPRAATANTAFTLSAPDGFPSNAVVVDNDGRVGVGTATPGAPIHIASSFAVLNLQDVGASVNQTGYVSFRNNIGTETAWVGFGTAGDPDFSIVNARSSGDIVLNPFSGNVGIATATPTAKLEVRGEVRYGSLGQYRPIAGEEPLRTIRGAVSANGSIINGSGFTVTRSFTGTYVISFNTAFSGAPAVTATAEYSANPGQAFAMTDGVATGSATIRVFGAADNFLQDVPFNFIAVGPR